MKKEEVEKRVGIVVDAYVDGDFVQSYEMYLVNPNQYVSYEFGVYYYDEDTRESIYCGIEEEYPDYKEIELRVRVYAEDDPFGTMYQTVYYNGKKEKIVWE